MSKNRLFKSIAIILCAVLCVNLISPAANAEDIPEPTTEAGIDFPEIDANPEYPETLLPALNAPTGENRSANVFSDIPIELNDDTILDELPEKREIGAKHFRLSDGSRAAVAYGYPVHEADENGQLIEIDNTLQQTEAGGHINYVQKSVSRQTTFFGNPEDGRLFRYDLKDGALEWGLVSESLQVPQISYEPSHAEKGREKLATKALSGLLTYENILPGLNLEYGLVGHDLKENLVLLSPETAAANPEGFAFRLYLENRRVEQADEKTIRILNASGEEEYIISAPYMMDDAGEISSKLRLLLAETEEAGTYTVRLIPDQSWLLDEERAYPVRIDPSIALAYSGYHTLQNATLASVDPNANLYNYGSMYIGRQGSMQNVRGAYKIQNLPVLSESDMIIQASVSFKVMSYSQMGSSHSGTMVLNMFPLTTDVAISALNWGNLAGYTGDYVIDSQRVEPNEAANIKPRITWDITRAVKTWYNDGTNYGMVIASENESPTTIRFVQLTTATNSQYINENSPIFTLTYLNQEGLENYLTYHSSGSGTMGAIHVGDFNGNLVYTYSDLDMSGAYLPISISHVYNHSRRGTSALVGSGMYYGNGMRLNLSMRIESCSVQGYPYQLTDADGTVHYFSLKSGTSGATGSVYEKEFETTTTLSKTSSGYTLDDGGTILYYFNTSGYLTQISDITNSKTQTLTYTSGRLTKVTDGAGRYAALTYNSSGYLTGITDPAGRTTSYSYANGNLTTITRPDGLTVTLTYTLTNSTYMLTKVKDVDNRSIGITYDTHAPYRVKQLLEYGADNSQGQRLQWTYSEGETTIIDRQGRSETMLFDNSGHTVVTRDGEGHAVYGGYGETADNLKHSLLYLSKMRGSIRNYAINHDFEASAISPWTAFANGEGSITLDTATVREGQKSLKIISTNSNSLTYGTCQQISIPGVAGKTYTLSGYVYFSNYNPTSTVGFKLGFSYLNTSNSWQNIYGPIAPAQNGWTRFSMTYTVPTSIGQEKLRVFFLMGGTGTCYLDSVQLVEGSVSESYNMLENGHFSDATGTTSPSKWTVISSGTGDGVTTGRGGNGYGLNGEALVEKGIYQVIPVKSGLAGDNYVFGAWAKAESIPRIGLFKNDNRDFAVRIRFIKSNNTYEESVFNFEAKTPNWQYLSGSVAAPCAYVSIQYALIYNNQKNPVVFDDAELYRERFGDRLEYDTYGRITSRTDPDGLTTTYEYQWAGRPEIKKVTFPDGTSTTYSYNSTNRRLLTVTDASGKVLTYSYDTNGNATSVSTTVGGQTLSSGTTAYSGSYVSSVTDPFGSLRKRYELCLHAEQGPSDNGHECQERSDQLYLQREQRPADTGADRLQPGAVRVYEYPSGLADAQHVHVHFRQRRL